jgi:hypothetical protein
MIYDLTFSHTWINDHYIFQYMYTLCNDHASSNVTVIILQDSMSTSHPPTQPPQTSGHLMDSISHARQHPFPSELCFWEQVMINDHSDEVDSQDPSHTD